MSDKWFFSLVVALGFGMLFLAISPFEERLPTGPMGGGGQDYRNIIVEDADLGRITSGAFGQITLSSDQGNRYATIGLSPGSTYDVQC